MKRFFALFLMVIVTLTACDTLQDDAYEFTNDGNISNVTNESEIDDSYENSTIEQSSSVEETSRDEEDIPVFREIDGINYYDVMASGAGDATVFTDPFTGMQIGNHSSFFPEDVEGYYLDDMLYLVDEETFYRILSKPVAGTGSIKWIDFRSNVSAGDNERFDGILPVEKMNDPLYVYMCKPSELPTVMNRINASNMFTEKETYNYVLPIGAIYNNPEKPIDDDAEFTICVGRTTLIVYTEEDGWVLVQDYDTPSKPNSIYYLPWELESKLGSMKLDSERVTLVDGHYEVKMTGAELNGAAGRGLGATGSVLHFWGKMYEIPEKYTILGVVASFECWIKEDEMAEYVVAAVGADWKESASGGGTQIFSGHNYAISTEPRVIFGHNVGPELYEQIMDTEEVQRLLNIE